MGNVLKSRNAEVPDFPYEVLAGAEHPTSEGRGEILQSSDLKAFSFAELKSATRNFGQHTLLGKGSVFKGWVDETSLLPAKPGTGMIVVVRRVVDQSSDDKEWLDELHYLAGLHHPNIVKLLGYCLEGDCGFMVHEFVPRGILENHLFRSSNAGLLSWNLRLKIALGAAKELAFLHTGPKVIIYKEFNISNTLLDSNYNAKLSDFKLPNDEASFSDARFFSSWGYFAPELVTTGCTSTKCDVYSFGVVLLELITGSRVIDMNRPSVQINLVEVARPYLTGKRNIAHLIDSHLEGQYEMHTAFMVAKLVSRCISTDQKCRPTMDQVVDTLEKLLQDFCDEGTRKINAKMRLRMKE